MNGLIFILAAYLMYALETGLRTLLAIPKDSDIAPSFLLILAVYIGTLAPPRVIVWAFACLGILTDIQAHYTTPFIVIGPATLGYLVGAYAVLQLRSLVFRESVITISVLSFAVGLFIHLTTLAMLKLRGLAIFTGEPIAISAADALVTGFLQLLYTAIVAIPVGFILLRTTSLWQFPGKVRMERYY